jgi:chemotaxis regulatin CheY-phosphate phosphatase CheZ
MEDEEIQKMIDIDKLKEDRKIAGGKLDDAMDKCMPEFDDMYDNVKKSTTEFLSLWKDYTNHKITEQEFLQITNKFAQIINDENEMYGRFTKILKPLETEFEKTCKILHDLESKHD